MRPALADRRGHPAAVDRWAARGAAAALSRERRHHAFRRPGILPQPAVARERCPVLRHAAHRAGPTGARGVGRVPSGVRAGSLHDRRGHGVARGHAGWVGHLAARGHPGRRARGGRGAVRARAAGCDDARRILGALQQVILGQPAATRDVLVCLLARGHVLLEGVPGTAKTLLVRTLALALDVKFQRIQFTPDLMPADITGISILTGSHEFTFRPGPIFADLVLADEINRAPAKTQAALLEAMQERTVTVDGVSYPLSAAFTVFATQNPIEFEGTYPLPEA